MNPPYGGSEKDIIVISQSDIEKSHLSTLRDAIAKGQDPIMFVMATGTGKAYTAFQIIYRLWKSGVSLWPHLFLIKQVRQQTLIILRMFSNYLISLTSPNHLLHIFLSNH